MKEVHPYTNTLGVAVRNRRKSLGMSQEALAELADCGTLFVLQLERGKPTVRLDKLLSVLKVLNLELRIQDGAGGVVAD